MILIVDDKPENILSLRRTLEIAGFETDSAESGEEALRKILKNDYSLIILDVQMPGMDGFEVAETLQGISKMKDVPIIFLSAVNTENRFITQGYKVGAVDYVVKPIDPDVFILKVQTLNRIHEQNRELEAIRKTLLSEVAVRRRTEKELAVLVEELRTTLHTIPQIAFTLSATGKLENYNQHWARLIGEEAEVLPVHPDDIPALERMYAAIEEGAAFEEELNIRTLPEGVYRCYLMHLIPVKDGGKIQKWVGTLTDVHERKAVNDQLEAAIASRTMELSQKNQELEFSNSELQQFASVTSHDLKEPLRKLQVYGSILQKRINQEAPQLSPDVSKIMGIAERMSNLINDLLDYSRLSMVAPFQPTDLNEIVSLVIADFDFQIAKLDAVVVCDALPVVDAIPGQIRQLFQNLIGNSLKFCRPDVPPRVSISSVPAGNSADSVTIHIADNGIGFDEAYLSKIFTIFQRLHPNELYEGTGIGLAIVKKIVDKHGGTITANSMEGTGATFIITLPVRQVQAGIRNQEAAFQL